MGGLNIEFKSDVPVNKDGEVGWVKAAFAFIKLLSSYIRYGIRHHNTTPRGWFT